MLYHAASHHHSPSRPVTNSENVPRRRARRRCPKSGAALRLQVVRDPPQCLATPHEPLSDRPRAAPCDDVPFPPRVPEFGLSRTPDAPPSVAQGFGPAVSGLWSICVTDAMGSRRCGNAKGMAAWRVATCTNCLAGLSAAPTRSPKSPPGPPEPCPAAPPRRPTHSAYVP